jgi:hypothetical protein
MELKPMNSRECVESLIKKSEKCDDGTEAMKYAQAALNIAQTIHVLDNLIIKN